jgi:hypothetical protein
MTENVLENKQHELLFRLADRQGVKPTEKVEDLYRNSVEIFDVDDFLETIDEIRKSDLIKDA